MNEETTHPSFAIPQGTSPGISARLADYEHVTHIRLEDSWKVADMFVTNGEFQRWQPAYSKDGLATVTDV